MIRLRRVLELGRKSEKSRFASKLETRSGGRTIYGCGVIRVRRADSGNSMGHAA